MKPFWWRWSSWATEALSGVALQLALWIWNPHQPWWLALLAGIAISTFYEWGLDANWWSWQDLIERAAGQIAIVALQAAL